MATKEIEVDVKMVVAAKQRHLMARQEKMPTAAVIALADMQQNPKPILNVVTDGRHVTLIGEITHGETYDPVGSALRYVRDDVDAVALFTDHKIYSKGMDDLLLVTRGVRRNPVICMDYVFNEYHVTEARAAGASALVAYSSILERPDLRRVVSMSQRWRMTTMIQVSDEMELEYAATLTPHVICIGTDHTFERERDLPLLERLMSYLPFNTKVMALGSMKSLDDIATVVDLGVDAIIIDESLLGREDELEQVRMLLAFRSEW